MKAEDRYTEFKSSFGDEVSETLVAFANTKGGRLPVGVNDKGSPVKNFNIGKESIQQWLNQVKTKTQPAIIPDVETKDLKGAKVVEFIMQEFPIKPVSFRGRYYKRLKNSNHQLSIAEIADLYLKSFNTSWDFYINSQFRIEDLSLEKVEEAIKKISQLKEKGILKRIGPDKGGHWQIVKSKMENGKT